MMNQKGIHLLQMWGLFSLTISLLACQPPDVERSDSTLTDHAAPAAATEIGQLTNGGCAHPLPEEVSTCQKLEAEILATTVRLELKLETEEHAIASIGHATIVNGRYLYTHNHFGVTVADFNPQADGSLTLWRSDGAMILDAAPLQAFDVFQATPETLLFDFGPYGGPGLFGVLGLASAKFDPIKLDEVRQGMEVAQIDWDGSTAHVDWVTVELVQQEAGLKILVLDNFVSQGSSGGGVFLDGFLLGNNWFRRTTSTSAGDVLDQQSIAVLNQPIDADTLVEAVASHSNSSG